MPEKEKENDEKKITFCPIEDINKNTLISDKKCDVYYSNIPTPQQKNGDAEKSVLTISPMTPDEIAFLKRKNVYDDTDLRYRWDWVIKYPYLAIEFFREVIYPRLGANLSISTVRDPTSKGGLGYSAFLKQLKKLGMNFSDLVEKAGFKKDYIRFVQVIIDFIEKKRENGFDKLKIFETILNKEKFNTLFTKARLVDGKRNRISARSCLLVISLALLKCSDYDCIFGHLKDEMSHSSIWKIVYDFIPILGQINPKINIENWLPPKMSILTYNDCITLSNERDDIEFDMDEDEFNEAMENRGKTSPGDVNLIWICKAEGHDWDVSYHQLMWSNSGCPYCYGNAPISFEDCVELGIEKGYELDISEDKFNTAMEERGTTKPSEVKLYWICRRAEGSHHFPSNYKNLNQDHGCPFCADKAKAIGKLIHPFLEYDSIALLCLRNCIATHEFLVSSTRQFKSDLRIMRNNNFIDSIETQQNIVAFSFIINEITVDFTLSIKPIVILNKCYKEYQNKKRFLIIVSILKNHHDLIDLNDLIQDTDDIDFRENIKVITFVQFLEFLGLKETKYLSNNEIKILSDFNQHVDLANDSLISDESLNELIELEKN